MPGPSPPVPPCRILGGQAHDQGAQAGGDGRSAGSGRLGGPAAADVLRGYTNKEVASELFLTARTVEYHLRNIYAKLGIDLRQARHRQPSGAPPDAHRRRRRDPLVLTDGCDAPGQASNPDRQLLTGAGAAGRGSGEGVAEQEGMRYEGPGSARAAVYRTSGRGRYDTCGEPPCCGGGAGPRGGGGLVAADAPASWWLTAETLTAIAEDAVLLDLAAGVPPTGCRRCCSARRSRAGSPDATAAAGGYYPRPGGPQPPRDDGFRPRCAPSRGRGGGVAPAVPPAPLPDERGRAVPGRAARAGARDRR